VKRFKPNLVGFYGLQNDKLPWTFIEACRLLKIAERQHDEELLNCVAVIYAAIYQATSTLLKYENLLLKFVNFLIFVLKSRSSWKPISSKREANTYFS